MIDPLIEVVLEHQALQACREAVDTPIEARRKIAGLLNDTHDYKWTVDSTGSVDISPENCYLERFTQFEAQIKAADSEALSALVQLELGIFRNTDDFPEEDVLKSKL